MESVTSHGESIAHSGNHFDFIHRGSWNSAIGNDKSVYGFNDQQTGINKCCINNTISCCGYSSSSHFIIIYKKWWRRFWIIDSNDSSIQHSSSSNQFSIGYQYNIVAGNKSGSEKTCRRFGIWAFQYETANTKWVFKSYLLLGNDFQIRTTF